MEIVANYINFHFILNAIIFENLSIILRNIVRPLVIAKKEQKQSTLTDLDEAETGGRAG